MDSIPLHKGIGFPPWQPKFPPSNNIYWFQVNKQLVQNKNCQTKLEGDLQNKDAALDIDHTCHNIHNNTADIQLHGGIERQNGTLGDTVTWERKSDRNVLDAQKTRAKSEKLRAEVEHGLATAASTMLNAWNNSNQSFTSRIEESSEAHCKGIL